MLHTTECGHVFHETCFEKIRRDEDNKLNCPCCRGEVKPALKQQIRDIDAGIHEMVEYIRMYPMIQRSYIEQQNIRIRELEAALREAKENKRIVSNELMSANKHNKLLLDNCRLHRKNMHDQYQKELEEHRKKKAEVRSQKKKVGKGKSDTIVLVEEVV
jgi:hypothetical protein